MLRDPEFLTGMLAGECVVGAVALVVALATFERGVMPAPPFVGLCVALVVLLAVTMFALWRAGHERGA